MLTKTAIDGTKSIDCCRRDLLRYAIRLGQAFCMASLGTGPIWFVNRLHAECLDTNSSAFRGANDDSFVRPSLAIELKTERFPFEIGYLEGPAYYDIPYLRVFVHEVLHLWQLLSQGFVANLALEEWGSLLEFEKGNGLEKQKRLQSRLRERGASGFSADDLLEGLARYWDIHILGPRRLLEWEEQLRTKNQPFSTARKREPSDLVEPYTSATFDSLVATADSYAKPYQLAIQAWGSQKAVILFPLVGYFALQTQQPVKLYEKALEVIAPRVDLPKSFSIHDEWRRYYPLIRDACNRLTLSETGAFLTPGWDVIARHRFTASNPVMGHYKALLASARALWGSDMDFFFAVPGDPEARGRLIAAFLPSATIFIQDCWVHESMLAEKEIKARTAGILPAKTLAQQATSITYRFRRLREATLMDRLQSSVGALTVSPHLRLVTGQPSQESLKFRWAVRSSEASDLAAQLNSSGASVDPDVEPFRPKRSESEDYETSAFAPMIVLIGTITAAYLADFVHKLVKDMRHAGLIIDLTGPSVEIREHPALDRGTLVVLEKGGKVTKVDPKGRDELLRLLSAFH